MIALSLALVFGGCDSGTSVGGSTSSTPDPPNTNTFRVAVVPSSSYPDGTVVFLIDGEQEAELTLVRGETYVFQMNNTPEDHPFFISTSSKGGDGGTSDWMDGVTGNFATGDEALTFVVPNGAPDLLFYQCANHLIMGWRLNIISP